MNLKIIIRSKDGQGSVVQAPSLAVSIHLTSANTDTSVSRINTCVLILEQTNNKQTKNNNLLIYVGRIDAFPLKSSYPPLHMRLNLRVR